MLACPWLSSSAVSMTTNACRSSLRSSRTVRATDLATPSSRHASPARGLATRSRIDALMNPRRDERHTMDRESSSAEVLHGNSAFDNLSGPRMLRIEHLSEQYLVVFDDTRRQAPGQR